MRTEAPLLTYSALIWRFTNLDKFSFRKFSQSKERNTVGHIFLLCEKIKQQN